MNPFEGLPKNHFKVVLADPPWQFKTWSHRGEGKGASQHYKCPSLDTLCQLPVPTIVQDNAALFLWVVQPQLPEAMRLLEAWGFKFKTVAFVWIKMPKTWTDLSWTPRIKPRMGLGYHTRSGTEQCWLAVRGKGYKRQPRGKGAAVEQVVFAPLREHSRKPDEIVQRIDCLVGDVPRIELFARVKRAGWQPWGNEVGKFGG